MTTNDSAGQESSASPTTSSRSDPGTHMNPARPLLLFNDECGVCRRIAGWVAKSGTRNGREATLDERAIGDDPEALRLLDPDLDIWDAYATIHLLMPDGSVKLGGEAVAEVLRRLPSTRWLARSFAFSVFGWRPFQTVLDVAYTALADVRPLLGCESCGLPSRWVRPFVAAFKWVRGLFRSRASPSPGRHFAPRLRPSRAATA